MKKILAAAVFCVIFLVPLFASAQFFDVPFGGTVTAIQPCDTGLLLHVEGASGIVELMWLWGELPYLMHIPPHPGQNILGEAKPATVPCFIGPVPYGVGLPIEFHGSSF